MSKTMNTDLRFTTDANSTKIGDNPNDFPAENVIKMENFALIICRHHILIIHIHIQIGGIGVQLGRVSQIIIIIIMKINK